MSIEVRLKKVGITPVFRSKREICIFELNFSCVQVIHQAFF